jgi:uncharacterized protein (TIGR02118 family)
MLKLIAIYPQPTDSQQFDQDYIAHLRLLHEQTGIPIDAKPYTVTKFLPSPTGLAPFYQMFSMPIASPEALQALLASDGMKIVGADAHRISTGGAPIIMVGNDE